MSTDISYYVVPNVATDIAGIPTLALKSGVDNLQRISYNNNNGADITSLNFNIIPGGGGNSILDPRVYINLPISFILTKATAWTGIAEAWPSSKAGFAQFPIAKAMNQLTININGTSLERAMLNKYMHALSLYNDLADPEFQSEYGTPDLLDKVAKYGTTNVDGCSQNSVSDYPYAGKYGTRRPDRYSWAFCDANGIGSSTTVPTQYIRITTSLRMTLPFSFFTNTGDKRGISQINTMYITANLDSSVFAEMVSLHESIPVTSITAVANGVPTCHTTWYLPQDFVIEAAKDKEGKFKTIVHPFSAIPAVYESSGTGNLNSVNVTAPLQTPPIALTRVPSKIFVYGYKDLTGMSAIQRARVGTTFSRITSLTLNYNGVNSHLTNFNEYDLWKLSAKNGYIHDYNTAETQTGTVVCIDVSKDVSLKKLFVGEASANSNLIVSATIAHPLGTDPTDATLHKIWKLRVVPVYDQHLTFEYGKPPVLTDSVVLSEDDKRGLEMKLSQNMQHQVVGGSFLSALWSGVKKGIAAAPHLINAFKAAKGAGGPTMTAGQVTAGQVIAGGGARGRLPSGTGVKGGGIDSGNPYSRLG